MKLSNPDFKYVRSEATDIKKTFDEFRDNLDKRDRLIRAWVNLEVSLETIFSAAEDATEAYKTMTKIWEDELERRYCMEPLYFALDEIADDPRRGLAADLNAAR